MNKPRRTRVAPGIYQDAYGFSVVAAVGSGDRLISSGEIRYPLGTSLEVLKTRWYREKTLLRDAYQRDGGKRLRGSLAADVQQYFKTVTLSRQRQQERTAQFNWWCKRFGNVPRGSLDPVKVRQALNSLRHPETGKPASASTKNKYRGALSHLFTVLDGKSAVNPIRDVPKDKEPAAEQRDQSYEFIQVLLAKMNDRGPDGHLSRTKAFLSVRAYCPITQAQLTVLKRTDVDLDGPEPSFLAPGRNKGRGTSAQRESLWDHGLAAFRLYDAADCWGRTPSRSSMRRIFIAARNAAVAELRETRPDVDWSSAARMLPKDLRHSFATLAYRVTGSLSITQSLLRHGDKKTTMRYAQGAVPGHLVAAGVAINAALKAIPPYVPPGRREISVVNDFHTKLPNTKPEVSGNGRKTRDLPNTRPRLVKGTRKA